MDIVLIANGICTLADVIIVNSTCVDLVSSYFFLGSDYNNCNSGKYSVILQPPRGGPSGGLGFEFECWVGFDFPFDIAHDLHRCKE
jgi:hypothetical protein